MSTLEEELGLGWSEARAASATELRHPSGAKMEALQLGSPATPLFSVFHRPRGRPKGVVVVCSPPFTEAARNQRRELLLGWLASQQGLAVVRFHPRGSGHSGGDTGDLTLETMQEDAEDVVQESLDRLQAPLIGLVGTRLGAVIAHRVAHEHPGTAVAWWQPVLDADSYMRELIRAAMIGALKRGVITTRRELESHLRTEEFIEILGSPVSRPFFDSLSTQPLNDAPPGPRRGLVAQMSRHNELQSQYATFVRRLRESGWTVDTLVIPDEETWWFGARGRGAELELRAVALQVVSATIDFFQVGAQPGS